MSLSEQKEQDEMNEPKWRERAVPALVSGLQARICSNWPTTATLQNELEMLRASLAVKEVDTAKRIALREELSGPGLLKNIEKQFDTIENQGFWELKRIVSCRHNYLLQAFPGMYVAITNSLLFKTRNPVALRYQNHSAGIDVTAYLGDFMVSVSLSDLHLNIFPLENKYRLNCHNQIESSEWSNFSYHPHVADRLMCYGDSAHRVTRARYVFRLADLLTETAAVLTCYNPGNPYYDITMYPYETADILRSDVPRLQQHQGNTPIVSGRAFTVYQADLQTSSIREQQINEIYNNGMTQRHAPLISAQYGGTAAGMSSLTDISLASIVSGFDEAGPEAP